jgi:hypothetical protein
LSSAFCLSALTARTFITEETVVSPMSIDRDTFEQASEEDLEAVPATDRVLGFLRVNHDRAFEASEIAAQLELETGTVSTALSRLKDRSLVEHKATYWAITDDTERLEAYSGYERATRLFDEQLGREDDGAWATHAPDEPHPSEGS